MSKNGEKLRKLIADANVEPEAALAIWNRGSAVPLSLANWFAYIREPTTNGWRPCPDSVIRHMQAALGASDRSHTFREHK